MELYLVRHGEAMSPMENPDRPLTSKGRLDVEAMAGTLRKDRVRFRKLYHSPRLRAVETAAILGDKFGVTPEEIEFLAPDDDPEKARTLLAGDDNVMLVGHLPHLPSLASLLMTGQPGKIQLDLKPAGAVCLEKGRTWSLRWVRRPESD